MGDTATITPKSTIGFKGKVYEGGTQYTVPVEVARALGNSVDVIKTAKSTVPTTIEVKSKIMERAKNTMMKGKEKKIRKKS